MDGNTHEHFLAALDESREGVVRFAAHLIAKGRNVILNGMRYAPHFDDRSAYADLGDLQVASTINVKRLGVEFSCQRDWPFGDRFIVDSKSSYDKALIKPAAFAILNHAMTHCAFVNSSDRDHWYVDMIVDGRRDAATEFYLTPLAQVRFFKLR